MEITCYQVLALSTRATPNMPYRPACKGSAKALREVSCSYFRALNPKPFTPSYGRPGFGGRGDVDKALGLVLSLCWAATAGTTLHPGSGARWGE